MTESAGRFIVIEGGEGVGKSTQVGAARASRCAPRATRSSSPSSPATRKPGAELRAVLLHADAPLDPRAELLLMLADRAQHVAEVIRPALGARRDRRVRPLRAVDARVPGRRARARRRRGRAAERVGGGRRRARRRVVLDVPDAIAEARVSPEPRPVRAGRRRVPRPGPGRVPRPRPRPGAGCSSTRDGTPDEVAARVLAAVDARRFRRLGAVDTVVVGQERALDALRQRRGTARPRVSARRAAGLRDRGRGARVRGDADRRGRRRTRAAGS